MTPLRGAFVLIAMVGCRPDYGLSTHNEIQGVANPPPLELPVQSDRVVQVIEPVVDVLWLVDNSVSMLAEQQGIQDNSESFIRHFVDTHMDWRVGVVSTDMSDPDHSGKLQGVDGLLYLDGDAPDPVTQFGDMVLLGREGAAKEQGRDAVYSAIELLNDGYNEGFYREEATLSVIVISDEDDRSGDDIIALEPFIQWLGGLKEDPENVTFSSIVNLDDECDPDQADVGEDYLAVTNAVGGIEWSICNDDWATVLDMLGMFALGLRTEFFLSDYPVEDTIEVWVVESEKAGGGTVYFERWEDWIYSPTRNSITFLEYVPDSLTQVFIDYERLAESY